MLQWQKQGESSQTWRIDESGMLSNDAFPGQVLVGKRGSLNLYYSLSLINKKLATSNNTNMITTWNFEALNSGFISTTSKYFVLQPLDGFVGPNVEAVLFIRSGLLPGLIGEIIDTILYWILFLLPSLSIHNLLHHWNRILRKIAAPLLIVISNFFRKKKVVNVYFPPITSMCGQNQKWSIDLAYEK